MASATVQLGNWASWSVEQIFEKASEICYLNNRKKYLRERERKSCECHRMKAAGKLNLMNVGYKICIFERQRETRAGNTPEKKNITPLFSSAFYVSPASKNLWIAPGLPAKLNGLPACCESLQKQRVGQMGHAPSLPLYNLRLYAAYIEIKFFYYSSLFLVGFFSCCCCCFLA